MHEATFVNEIFSVLRDKFNEEAINSIISINVKLSPFSHVTQEGLRETYQEFGKNSSFEHIRLNIEPLNLLLRCRSCKNTSTVSSPIFKCPHCSSQDIEINMDKEFVIESIEINKRK